MMDYQYTSKSSYGRLAILAVMAVVVVLIYYAVLSSERGVLTVVFLDVGQGDAVFIEAPNGNQVLYDGGPGGAVLAELGKVMPFYDRSIDMVILSHPDRDHIGGIAEVLERYEVEMVLEPGVSSDNGVYNEIKRRVARKDIEVLTARRGMRIDLGADTYVDILFPDRDVSGFETNSASVVARVVYGETSVLLSGDLPQSIENYVVDISGESLNTSVLKLGHHGSKTSTSESFLGSVDPELAVISAGVDNRYGHPHQEVLERLERFSVPYVATYEEGTIVLVSDGNAIVRQ